MPPVEFKPTISAAEWLQTYALDRIATGTGCLMLSEVIFTIKFGLAGVYMIYPGAWGVGVYQPLLCTEESKLSESEFADSDLTFEKGRNLEHI
jgi:hypothetical protein